MRQHSSARVRREIVQQRNLRWLPRQAPKTPRYEMDRRIEAKKAEIRLKNGGYDGVDNVDY